jgi:probable F420-dependent oxidoreductase
MDIAVTLPQLGHAAGPDAIRAAAIQAEELGFSYVWVNDHITFPVGQSHPSKYMYDPLLTLATAAAVTTDIRLGGQVTAAYYAPLWLANALASLDSLSGGRLNVAIGVGWSPEEFAALGSSFADRGERTNEIIAILRAAWHGRPFRHHGKHYDLPEVQILPSPAHEIPLWIAGETAPAYRRAIEHGDGFHAGSWALAPDAMAAAVARIREARPEPEFVFSVYTHDWDPLKVGRDAVRTEHETYAQAGVQCVVVAPDQREVHSWLRSVEELAAALELPPRRQVG